MTTSHDFSASPETLPTSTIFPWSIRIESPLVVGFFHSPLTIVPRLTIAVFISASRDIPLLAEEGGREAPSLCSAHPPLLCEEGNVLIEKLSQLKPNRLLP